MNKYDLMPTKSNIVKSIEKDVTGRNDNLYHLLRFLNFQDQSWSIAINGSWGSGKTFFIKQCKLMLDNAQNCSDSEVKKAIDTLCPDKDHLEKIQRKPFRTVYYNAWEHDSDEDPIVSLIQCFATAGWSKTVREVLLGSVSIVKSIVKVTTQVDLSSLTDFLKGKMDKQEDLEHLKKKFNDTLNKLAPDNGKLIVFVDELDRCKPTYTIKLLERIKHYFNNPNVTFIFAVDLEQLQYTVNRYYGNEFDGYQYLDRFFDLVISLPDPDLDKYFDNTKGILEAAYHFDQFDPKESYYYCFCKELIDRFSFSIRQINHFYLRTNSATYNLIDSTIKPKMNTMKSENNGRFIIYEFVLPLMIALSQENIEQYNKFISGQGPKEIVDILGNSRFFEKVYRNMLDSPAGVDIGERVRALYRAIFKPGLDEFRISSLCIIERPNLYRKKLIEACSLLSTAAKVD